jgi:hypothetical protein
MGAFFPSLSQKATKSILHYRENYCKMPLDAYSCSKENELFMSTPTPEQPKKKKSRAKDYIILVVILAVLVSAALFQEQLMAFFTLKQWDKGAPARQVTAFLTALQKEDRAAADALLDTSIYKPLETNGKWNGYYIVSQAGRMDFSLADTAPKGTIPSLEVEFNAMGEGSATVSAPDGHGKMVNYILKIVNGTWKIAEMRGGKAVIPPATKMPASKGPGGFTPPGSASKKAAPTPNAGGKAGEKATKP